MGKLERHLGGHLTFKGLEGLDGADEAPHLVPLKVDKVPVVAGEQVVGVEKDVRVGLGAADDDVVVDADAGEHGHAQAPALVLRALEDVQARQVGVGQAADEPAAHVLLLAVAVAVACHDDARIVAAAHRVAAIAVQARAVDG